MRKIRKLSLIVLALVLVMCCVLTGCNKNKHEHNYSQVGHDETNHWNYCPDDQAKDEASVAPHTYKWESNDSQHWQVCTVCGYIVTNSYANHIDSDENGKCDVCEHTVPVPIKYGSFSGTIKLHKQGNLTASAEGVTVVIKQGDKEVKPSDLVVNTDGTFSFTAIEGEYSLTASKQGYKSVSNEIEISKAEPVTGYDVLLEYELLTLAKEPGWENGHDYTHQNDENAYFVQTATQTGMTLDVMTVDTYDDAMFTYYAKKGQIDPAKPGSRVGVMVQFYDVTVNNKTDSGLLARGDYLCDFVWWNISQQSGNWVIEWYNDTLWPEWTLLNCVAGKSDSCTLTAEEIAAYEEGTLKLSVARHENMIFGLVNGEVRSTIVLSEKYANADAHFGMIGMDPLSADGDNRFYFEITEGIASILPTDTFTVTIPEVEHLTITTSRESGLKGQGVILSAIADEGYELTSLKVGDTEYASQLVDGKIEIANYNGEAITASVVDAKPVTAVISADGWNGAELIFTRGDNVKNVTVADGKATFDGLTGPWAVSTVYMGKTFSLGTIVVDGEGSATLDSAVTLFSGKDIYNWNEATSSFNPVSGKGTITQVTSNMIEHESAVSYQKVAITQYVKADLTGERTGVFVKIGNKYVQLNIKHSGSDKGVIEWDCNTDFDGWSGYHVANITESTWDKASFSEYCSWGNWCMFNENLELMYRNDSADDHKLTTEEFGMFENGTLKLTLVRDGANIYAFVNDHFIGSRCLTTNDVIDEEDAAGNVTVGLFGCGLSIGTTLNYQIETDISAYTAKLGESNFKYTVSGDNITVKDNREGYSVGEIAKIEFVPDDNYEILDVKVNGVSLGAKSSISRYILSKTQGEVTIEVEAVGSLDGLTFNVKGIESGADASLDGKELTMSNSKYTHTATIADGKFVITGKVYPGTYAITSKDGFEGSVDVTIDGVADDVTLTRVLFVHNYAGDKNIGDSTKVDYSDTKNSKLKTLDATNLFAVLKNSTFDGALSVTFKKSYTNGGKMGVGYAFGGGVVGGELYGDSDQRSLLFSIENNDQGGKVQWYGDWFWGFQPVAGAGSGNSWDLSSGSYKGYYPFTGDIRTAYESGAGITLTIARIGNVYYALVDGVIVSAQYCPDFAEKAGRFYVVADGANAGQEIGYTLYNAEETKTLIDGAMKLLSGEDEVAVRSISGNGVSYADGKVAFDGAGVAMIGDGALHESISISVGTQWTAMNEWNPVGVSYMFENGKYINFRIELNNKKVQFSPENVFYKTGSGQAHLQWWTDYSFDSMVESGKITSEQAQQLLADLQDSSKTVMMTLERNGKNIIVKFAGVTIDTIELDDEYAEMGGHTLIEVYNGNNVGMTFEYSDFADTSVEE